MNFTRPPRFPCQAAVPSVLCSPSPATRFAIWSEAAFTEPVIRSEWLACRARLSRPCRHPPRSGRQRQTPACSRCASASCARSCGLLLTAEGRALAPHLQGDGA